MMLHFQAHWLLRGKSKETRSFMCTTSYLVILWQVSL